MRREVPPSGQLWSLPPRTPERACLLERRPSTRCLSVCDLFAGDRAARHPTSQALPACVACPGVDRALHRWPLRLPLARSPHMPPYRSVPASRRP